MSRTRVSVQLRTTSPGYYAKTLDNTGYVYPTQAYTIISFQRDRTMTDIVTPGFYKRQKAGEIINNPMDKKVTTYHCVGTSGVQGITNGLAHYTTKTCIDLSQIYAYTCPPPIGRDASIANLMAHASTKAWASVTSEKVQLGVTLGELRETKEMLIRTAHLLKNLKPALLRYQYNLQQLLRAKGKKALSKKLYLDLENAWMEVRMGWRPFKYECEQLHAAMQELKEQPKRQTFRGKATIELSNAQNNLSWSSDSRSVSGNRTYEERITARAGILCEQRYGGVPDTYGLCKFPQTVWELTTLSWAVDYFFNVGEVVAAYVPDSLWLPLASWCTTHSYVSCVNEVVTANYAGAVPPLTGGYGRKEVVTVSRVPIASVGFALRPRMNVAKYLDVLAVTRQHIVPLVRTLVGMKGRLKP